MQKQIILVTGAGTGIGKLSARSLAEAGHVVYASMRDIAGRNSGRAAEMRSHAAARGLQLHPLELDVLSQASADAAAEKHVSAEESVFLGEVKAQASRAVPWHEQYLKIHRFDHHRLIFRDVEAWLNGLDVPIVAEIAKEAGLSHHLLGFWVVSDLALVLCLHLGGVPDVVDVAVRQEQGGNPVALGVEPFSHPLGCIDQDS